MFFQKSSTFHQIQHLYFHIQFGMQHFFITTFIFIIIIVLYFSVATIRFEHNMQAGYGKPFAWLSQRWGRYSLCTLSQTTDTNWLAILHNNFIQLLVRHLFCLNRYANCQWNGILSPFFVDPSLVLPALVCLIYSSDATLYSSATTTLLQVLIHHNHKPEVVSMVLDSLRYSFR